MVLQRTTELVQPEVFAFHLAFQLYDGAWLQIKFKHGY